MAAPTTVLGAMVALCQADLVLFGTALTPGLLWSQGIWVLEIPEEKLPVLPFLVLTDPDPVVKWITQTSRLETHKPTATCYAKAATAAGQQAPVEYLADQVERVLDWDDLTIPNTTPVTFLRLRRQFKESTKRAADGERVFEIALEWQVTFGWNHG